MGWGGRGGGAVGWVGAGVKGGGGSNDSQGGIGI